MLAPNAKAQALYNVNLLGGCKANLNGLKSPDSMHLQEWFCDIPSCQTYSAHNVNQKVGLKQFRGTFGIGTGLASQFIVGMDKDPTGLGHWVACTLSGCYSQNSLGFWLLPMY